MQVVFYNNKKMFLASDVASAMVICTGYLHARLKKERKFPFLDKWPAHPLLLLRMDLRRWDHFLCGRSCVGARGGGASWGDRH